MLWTITETARQLAVSVRTIERLIKDGELKVIRVRRSRRLSAADVQAWTRRISPDDNQKEHNESARARMQTEETPCADEEKTVMASTNNQVRRTGTAVIQMRPGSAAAEVQARIAARKQKRS